MKRLFIQLSSVVLLLTVFSFHSQGQYNLEYNLEIGKTYKQLSVTDMNMEMDAMGQKVQMNVKQETGFHYSVVALNADVYDIQLTYQKFKVSMDVPAPFTIDTDAPENSTDANMGNAFKSIIGIPIDIQMTKQGKITSIRGIDKLKENLSATGNPQLNQMFDQLFSEEIIQKQIEHSSAYFPGKPVAIGDSWDVVSSVNNQGIDIISKMNLTLKEVTNNMATLGVTGTLYTPEGGIVTNIQGMEASVSVDGKQAGSMQIDLKTGWIERADITQNFKPNVEIMGQTMQQDIAIKMTITAE